MYTRNNTLKANENPLLVLQDNKIMLLKVSISKNIIEKNLNLQNNIFKESYSYKLLLKNILKMLYTYSST